MTRRVAGPGDSVQPMLSFPQKDPLFNRPCLLIATASISDKNIQNNGLQQNCYLIQRLAEAIGWLPIFVVNEVPKDLTGIPDFLRTCRLGTIEEFLRQPIPVKVYLEIGMSMSGNLRRFLKMCGARTCKLYLGNILNIDIETPMFFPGMMFSHHVIGEQDEIWTSPHYAMNLEQAACLNQVEPEAASAKIAPYVWDPSILTDNGRRKLSWRPLIKDEKPCFLIMEPNISFQKTAIVPLMILEEQSRKNPEKEFTVVVVNGERLLSSGYYTSTLAPCLSIIQRGFVKQLERKDMVTVMTQFPSAIPVCHHVNNEFNQMVLEFMYAGFPVLHNCEAWKDFGYFQPENDFKAAAKLLDPIVDNHGLNLEIQKSHGMALTWRHSIQNPDVQTAWRTLLEEACSAKN